MMTGDTVLGTQRPGGQDPDGLGAQLMLALAAPQGQ
jgi:hypothetical protein